MSSRGAYALALGIIAAISLALFFWADGGNERASQDGVRIIYLALTGILVGVGVLSYGARRPGKMIRDLLIWSGILTALAIGIAQWQENQSQPTENGVRFTHLAEPATEAAPKPRSTSATLSKSADGHFWTEAKVNGRSQRFMVDTGASYVALSLKDARRLGVSVQNLKYETRVQTANGETKAARIVLRDIRIAGIRVQNVEALVLSEGLDTALLGMSFLGRLKSFEAHAGDLRLSG